MRYRNRPVEPPNLLVRAWFKVQSVGAALSHPYLLSFIAFLVIQGFTMPYYKAYDYVFAIEVLKIPMTLINLQDFIFGNLSFFMPWVYQTYYADKDFKCMFHLAQRVFVMSDAMAVIMALKWNTYIGIPTVVLYILSGKIASVLEGTFKGMPSYILFTKLVPTGVESTMMGTIDMIMGLTCNTFREMTGVAINDRFVHVTNANLDNYYLLKVIGVCMNCIAFYFMAIGMVPTRAQAEEL